MPGATYEAIEFPATGATYSHDEYGVYRYGTYPRGSVLEGQERRSALGTYPTLEEARLNHPGAEWDGGSGYREVTVPRTPPADFRPEDIGEHWDDTDY